MCDALRELMKDDLEDARKLGESEGEAKIIINMNHSGMSPENIASITGKDLHSTETLASHADWALKFMSKYDKIDESNIDGIINEEIGLVFKEVLECAGVYKCTDEGRAAFQKFIDAVNA